MKRLIFALGRGDYKGWLKGLKIIFKNITVTPFMNVLFPINRVLISLKILRIIVI